MTGKQATGKLADDVSRLGYTLMTGSVDSFGRKWPYRTFPDGSGPINQFHSAAQVRRWIAQVKHVREWQQGALVNA